MDPSKKVKTDSKSIYNLDELINFRRQMHQHPELGFKEHVTQKHIKQFLIDQGVEEQQIKICAETGFTVDLFGKAPATSQETTLIALRTDIDALSMKEETDNLDYKSQNLNAAHACGHDGHTASLMGFVQLFMEKIEEIPSNKGVRLLIQPSEEGPVSGAKVMIKEGCLQGVNECYGFHNYPTHTVGHLLVKSGVMMAAVAIIKINLIGQGGHGSAPQNAIDPAQMSVDFHLKLKKMHSSKFQGRKFVNTFPVLRVGETYNVIANSAYIEGTLRSFEDGLPEEFERELTVILEELKAEYQGDYKLDFNLVYDQVNNTEKETEHVIRIGKQFFGEEKVGEFGVIPSSASEDFSFFIQKVPGCFYFLGSGRKMNDIMLHDSRFNFNDDLIPLASQFFMKLIEDRLQL